MIRATNSATKAPSARIIVPTSRQRSRIPILKLANRREAAIENLPMAQAPPKKVVVFSSLNSRIYASPSERFGARNESAHGR